MNAVLIVLGILCIVILIVSIIYITTNIRHKERIALLEANKDPKLFEDRIGKLAPLKWGFLLIGAGLGFFSAFMLDNFVFNAVNDTEAIYPSMVFICGGLGLVLFYKFFGKD
jgi:hypothetical protein